MKHPDSWLARTAAVLLAAVPAAVQAQSDSFATATVITSLPVTGTNTGATKESGEPNHGNNAGGASVWYSWTATANGHYRVDLLGSSYDTLLGIYTGTGVNALLPVTQNDDRAAGVTTSQAVIYARAGQEFRIAVDGYRGTAAATGSITLNISPLPAAETPPANDVFASPATLGMTTYATQTVSTVYGSREWGEPLIANIVGANSLWWAWTAPADAEVEISTAGTAFNTVLAVYTGNSVDALTLVVSNDNAPALTTSRVLFNAVAGTEYHIAADVSTASITIPSGNLNLTLSANIYLRTILPAGSTWAWMHPGSGIDPAIADTDFNTTWYSSAAYDGPAFNAPSGAILGYGGIDYGTTVTTLPDPGAGSRYTAYFRRSFTVAQDQSRLKADVLADDGAIIYIDGMERGRVNMSTTAADMFTLPALDADNTETAPVAVELGSITAGTHETAVSVHNAGIGSSDLGFDLRLYADTTPPPVDFVLGPAGAFTGFEESLPGSTSYLFGSNGSTELGWNSAGGGIVRAPASHPVATGAGAPPASRFLSINDARANPFHSDRISLAGLTNQQKANIVASASVRTFTTSTTTFEIEDDLTISLEGSTDGTTFSVLTDILPLTAGGTPDALIAISAATGDFMQFSTAPGTVPDTTAYLRFSVIGGTSSPSEYIYLDNLRVAISGTDPAADTDGDGQSNTAETVAGTDPNDPASVLRVSSAVSGAGGLDFTFDGVAGKTYQIEYSAALSAGWTVLRDDIGTAATGPVAVTGLILPEGAAGFVRVKVKP